MGRGHTETTVPVRQSALSGIWNRGLMLAQMLLNGNILSRETAQIVREHVVPSSTQLVRYLRWTDHLRRSSGDLPLGMLQPKKQNAKSANRTDKAALDWVL